MMISGALLGIRRMECLDFERGAHQRYVENFEELRRDEQSAQPLGGIAWGAGHSHLGYWADRGVTAALAGRRAIAANSTKSAPLKRLLR
jgi:hypothetical protein